MEDGAWKPIDPAKVYTVATNNFVRQGGDGYTLFADNAQNAYDYGPSLEQVVADYLTANRPYTPKLDGRITEIAATVLRPRLTRAQLPRPLQQRRRLRRLQPSQPHRQRAHQLLAPATTSLSLATTTGRSPRKSMAMG